jgi:hypothetical protein
VLVERIQSLVPAPDGGDDFVGVFGPAEGFRVFVCLNEEAVDGRLQRDEGMEHAALQAALGQRGEEALDSVDPRGRGGREVKGEAALGPGTHAQMCSTAAPVGVRRTPVVTEGQVRESTSPAARNLLRKLVGRVGIEPTTN